MVIKYGTALNLKTNTYEVFDNSNHRRKAVDIPTLREALRIALALNAQVAQHGTPEEEEA